MFIALGCSRLSDEYIIVTVGMHQDPSIPRRAVEITSSELFACLEVIKQPRYENITYKYFKGSFTKSDFRSCKRLILEHFEIVDTVGTVVDATEYQLVYSFDGQKESLFIDSGQLSQEQQFTLDSILAIGLRAEEQIEFHDFPKLLLFQRLDLPQISDSIFQNSTTSLLQN
jgi:hypothetical protein